MRPDIHIKTVPCNPLRCSEAIMACLVVAIQHIDEQYSFPGLIRGNPRTESMLFVLHLYHVSCTTWPRYGPQRRAYVQIGHSLGHSIAVKSILSLLLSIKFIEPVVSTTDLLPVHFLLAHTVLDCFLVTRWNIPYIRSIERSSSPFSFLNCIFFRKRIFNLVKIIYAFINCKFAG